MSVKIFKITKCLDSGSPYLLRLENCTYIKDLLFEVDDISIKSKVSKIAKNSNCLSVDRHHILNKESVPLIFKELYNYMDYKQKLLVLNEVYPITFPEGTEYNYYEFFRDISFLAGEEFVSWKTFINVEDSAEQQTKKENAVNNALTLINLKDKYVSFLITLLDKRVFFDNKIVIEYS